MKKLLVHIAIFLVLAGIATYVTITFWKSEFSIIFGDAGKEAQTFLALLCTLSIAIVISQRRYIAFKLKHSREKTSPYDGGILGITIGSYVVFTALLVKNFFDPYISGSLLNNSIFVHSSIDTWILLPCALLVLSVPFIVVGIKRNPDFFVLGIIGSWFVAALFGIRGWYTDPEMWRNLISVAIIVFTARIFIAYIENKK